MYYPGSTWDQQHPFALDSDAKNMSPDLFLHPTRRPCSAQDSWLRIFHQRPMSGSQPWESWPLTFLSPGSSKFKTLPGFCSGSLFFKKNESSCSCEPSLPKVTSRQTIGIVGDGVSWEKIIYFAPWNDLYHPVVKHGWLGNPQKNRGL